MLDALATSLDADDAADETRLETDAARLATDDDADVAALEADEVAELAAVEPADDAALERAPAERQESDVPAATVVGELLPTTPLLSVM